VAGNRLHKQYSYFNKNFDRVRILALVENYLVRNALEHKIEYKDFIVVLRGIFDNLRVIRYRDKKYIVLLELKTTTKNRMWAKDNI
jgi:hypothetical protein